MDIEGIIWILNRIRYLESAPNRETYYWSIWQGSYDVILCEQDKVDNVEIPKRRFKEVVDLGFIRSEILHKQSPRRTFQVEIWKITEDGEKFLNEHSHCL